MARLKTMQQDKFILLLWGPAMSGKTVLASQFPNPYFIDLDNQMGSVRTVASSQGKDVDFPVILIDEKQTEDEDFIELCGKQFVNQMAWPKLKKIVEILSRKLTLDDTLVLDNLSRASEYLTAYIKKRSGHDPMQIQDWGVFAEEVRTLVDFLKEASTNSIVIGHEGTTKDDMSGKLYRNLLMPGSSKDRLPSKVSDYLYMKTDVSGPRQNRKVVRQLQSVPDPSNPVGTRSAIPNLDNPTFEKMKPYLEGYVGRELGAPTWTPKDD
jgi:hypothetical protein